MNKNEIKDALEALELAQKYMMQAFDRIHCLPRETDDVLAHNLDHTLAKTRTAIESLTRLSAIEPLLLELIEARGKATQGEWKSFYEGSGDFALYQVKSDGRNVSHHYVENTDDDGTFGTVSGPDSCMFGGEQSERNANFITLSANNIAKIKEIMEGCAEIDRIDMENENGGV